MATTRVSRVACALLALLALCCAPSCVALEYIEVEGTFSVGTSWTLAQSTNDIGKWYEFVFDDDPADVEYAVISVIGEALLAGSDYETVDIVSYIYCCGEDVDTINLDRPLKYSSTDGSVALISAERYRKGSAYVYLESTSYATADIILRAETFTADDVLALSDGRSVIDGALGTLGAGEVFVAKYNPDRAVFFNAEFDFAFPVTDSSNMFEIGMALSQNSEIPNIDAASTGDYETCADAGTYSASYLSQGCWLETGFCTHAADEPYWVVLYNEFPMDAISAVLTTEVSDHVAASGSSTVEATLGPNERQHWVDNLPQTGSNVINIDAHLANYDEWSGDETLVVELDFGDGTCSEMHVCYLSDGAGCSLKLRPCNAANIYYSVYNGNSESQQFVVTLGFEAIEVEELDWSAQVLSVETDTIHYFSFDATEAVFHGGYVKLRLTSYTGIDMNYANEMHVQISRGDPNECSAYTQSYNMEEVYSYSSRDVANAAAGNVEPSVFFHLADFTDVTEGTIYMSLEFKTGYCLGCVSKKRGVRDVRAVAGLPSTLYLQGVAEPSAVNENEWTDNAEVVSLYGQRSKWFKYAMNADTLMYWLTIENQTPGSTDNGFRVNVFGNGENFVVTDTCSTGTAAACNMEGSTCSLEYLVVEVFNPDEDEDNVIQANYQAGELFVSNPQSLFASSSNAFTTADTSLLETYISTGSALFDRTTEEFNTFTFPAKDEPYTLVISHDTGEMFSTPYGLYLYVYRASPTDTCYVHPDADPEALMDLVFAGADTIWYNVFPSEDGGKDTFIMDFSDEVDVHIDVVLGLEDACVTLPEWHTCYPYLGDDAGVMIGSEDLLVSSNFTAWITGMLIYGGAGGDASCNHENMFQASMALSCSLLMQRCDEVEDRHNWACIEACDYYGQYTCAGAAYNACDGDIHGTLSAATCNDYLTHNRRFYLWFNDADVINGDVLIAALNATFPYAHDFQQPRIGEVNGVGEWYKRDIAADGDEDDEEAEIGADLDMVEIEVVTAFYWHIQAIIEAQVEGDGALAPFNVLAFSYTPNLEDAVCFDESKCGAASSDDDDDDSDAMKLLLAIGLGLLGAACLCCVGAMLMKMRRKEEKARSAPSPGNYNNTELQKYSSESLSSSAPSQANGQYAPMGYGASPVMGGGNQYNKSPQMAPAAAGGHYGGNPQQNQMSNARIGLSNESMSAANWEIQYDEVEMQKELGRGSFGVVYKGMWRNSEVAVKQILNELNAEELKDFRSEAELMSRLRPHMNVVLFLGVCTNPTRPLCIITEFLANGGLDALLASEKDIDLNFVLSLSKGIAAGIVHLHSENIVHRDLAARNILLSGQFDAKVADFGMSRAVAEDEGKTKADSGPLKWMAPECLTSRTYSPKSDVWSYGVTVIEMLTRDLPYPAMDPVQCAIKVSSHGLKPDIPDYTPDGLRVVLERIFSYEPLHRPSMQEIFEALNALTIE